MWIEINEKHKPPVNTEVLGYNKKWIHPDFNPDGIRIGYLTDFGNFVSAVYESENDTYTYCSEEGDDYEYSQVQKDGTKKTWYNGEEGETEGYRPNMPTHFMYIPKFNEINNMNLAVAEQAAEFMFHWVEDCGGEAEDCVNAGAEIYKALTGTPMKNPIEFFGLEPEDLNYEDVDDSTITK